MKNYGAKSDILLDKQVITQTIIMRNICKLHLIQMIFYLWKKNDKTLKHDNSC